MENNAEFDRIMQQIRSGLTGDAKTDLPYLQAQCRQYAGHPQGAEILRACGRMIFEALPEKEKAAYAQAMRADDAGIGAALQQARLHIAAKEFQKAQALLEPLVRDVEEKGLFQDDRNSEYHTFREPFEELLYRFRNQPQKELRSASVPLSELYLLYGILLVDLKRLPAARKALREGLRWNPMDFRIHAEYIETYKLAGDLDRFFRFTLAAFKIAFRPGDLARCYRNLGYYFIEKELYAEAMGCFLLSLRHEMNSKQAMSEMRYIQITTGGRVPQPSPKEVEGYGVKYGFPTQPDRDILGLSYHLGRQAMEEKAYSKAGYFLRITYALTKDPNIKQLLDSFPQSAAE